jgi:hypothetical protein
MPRKNKMVLLLQYFAKNLMVMVGIVMIWRGIWVLLDVVDEMIFGQSQHWLTAALGVLAGLLLLYLPDKDLDEIKKL